MAARWFVVFVAVLAVAPPVAAEVCGREHYPDADSFDPGSVVDAAMWQRFQDRGGFAGGVGGEGNLSLEVTAPGSPPRRYLVSLEEAAVREYTGGATDAGAILRLTVEETVAATSVLHNFSQVSIARRPGAALALVADANGTSLSVFWRWAWVECSPDFPLAYYVFHASLEDSEVVSDNGLVYFEADRPSRGPPVDLILLITAGIAVSVIFLIARRALNRDRTIK